MTANNRLLYNLISALLKWFSGNHFICLTQGTLQHNTFLFSVLSPPSGSSLFSSGRTCPWPLPLSDNSEARLLSPTHSFSALLEVRCKPGFALPNGLDVTVRRCQGDRQWSGDDPICTGGFQYSQSFYVRLLYGKRFTPQVDYIWGNKMGCVSLSLSCLSQQRWTVFKVHA